MTDFERRCVQMNLRYELPVASMPTTKELGEPVTARLVKLKAILQKELDEINEVLAKATAYETESVYHTSAEAEGVLVSELDVLVDVADLMVDLQVYCVSEMVKFGIPLAPVQAIVMDSNESKLGANGEVLKDSDGKFLKGPNYWKPEPAIRAYIKNHRDVHGCNDPA